MIKYIIAIIGFFCTQTTMYANFRDSLYQISFIEINKMLLGDNPNFRRGVFLTENAYYEGIFTETSFNDVIWLYASLCREVMLSGDIIYTETDKNNATIQCAAFVLMTDTITVQLHDNTVKHNPFKYNHEDFAGQKDCSNMFVSTLMQTKKGNCHSLPYLYKMIMDELGYESHLALAPNHIYIKANNKKVGWYNIELTCGDFPTDAWYAASGYLHTDAIRNGIYMKALTDKEAVAMTLVDLAQGYQTKFGIEDGSFIIKCCDTALEHFLYAFDKAIYTSYYVRGFESSANRLRVELTFKIHQSKDT